MKKQILLCTGFLIMNFCACGTGAATEERTTTEQPTIIAEVTATPEITGDELSIKKEARLFTIMERKFQLEQIKVMVHILWN